MNTKLKHWFLGIVSVTSMTSQAGATPLSISELSKLLEKSTRTEKIITIIQQADIYLRGGEPAILIAAEMDREFHFRYGYILVRPKLKQARLLNYWGAQYAGIKFYRRGKQA